MLISITDLSELVRLWKIISLNSLSGFSYKFNYNTIHATSTQRDFFLFFKLSVFVYSLSDFADTSDRYEDLLAHVWHLWLVVIGGVSREVNLVFRSARDRVLQAGRVHLAWLAHYKLKAKNLILKKIFKNNNKLNIYSIVSKNNEIS